MHDCNQFAKFIPLQSSTIETACRMPRSSFFQPFSMLSLFYKRVASKSQKSLQIKSDKVLEKLHSFQKCRISWYFNRIIHSFFFADPFWRRAELHACSVVGLEGVLWHRREVEESDWRRRGQQQRPTFSGTFSGPEQTTAEEVVGQPT